MKIAMFCCEILITGMKISIRLIKSIGNIMKKNKKLLRIWHLSIEKKLENKYLNRSCDG